MEIIGISYFIVKLSIIKLNIFTIIFNLLT